MQQSCKPAGPDLRLPRSAVTNGTRLFLNEITDYRTREARRFRDILTAILDGLETEETEASRQIARRLALMCLKAELLEQDAVNGKDIDIEQFGALSERISRIFTRLNDTKRSPRVANPLTLDSYVEHNSQREPVAPLEPFSATQIAEASGCQSGGSP